ncbi:glycosyltransferase [Flavobacterium frigidarium]|uniref:glycosyltransferase n=1 Tax=Flavobacterium frigidarium TaxID=99286 RepID=UPI00047BBE6C|nr:glycosyltransferase [Flavobacterium frigidarium]
MESGVNKKLNILLISSFMPEGASEMVLDMHKALLIKHNVNLLLKYRLKGNSSYLAVYSEFDRLLNRGLNAITRLKRNIFSNEYKRVELPQYHFFGIDDANPSVSSKKILKQIKIEYDVVIVFFWQNMITAKTIYDIYEKLQIPILFISPDMFPMTGGCSYFWECTQLSTSCGNCPGLLSNNENDATRINFLYKKDKLKNVNSVFLGNTWMNSFAAKTGLFKKIDKIYPIIDENIFKPRDKEQLKSESKYSGKIVLFFGAMQVNEERKGYAYLVKALQLLAVNRPELVPKIILLIAGKDSELPELTEFTLDKRGYLSFEQLAVCYAMSDIFLSPSIQDAGPMMLNQSLLCGTPAVAFEMGTACDILNSSTGYVAKYKDSEDFCRGILSLIDKSSDELQFIKEECRSQSMNKYSYDAFTENIVRVYNEVK